MNRLMGLVALTLLLFLIIPCSAAGESNRTIPTSALQINSLAPVPVSLPSITATQGQTISVPITTGDVTNRGVISFDFEVRFDPNVLRPVVATPTTNAGTLSSGFSITANPNLTGRLLVSGYSAYPLSGQGTLLKLNFVVLSQPPSTTPYTWQSFMFNEGDPAVTLSVGSTSTTTPIPVSIGSAAGPTGSTLTVPLVAGNTTSRNAISYDFDLRFDPTMIRPVFMEPTSKTGTLSNDFNITVNTTINGRLLVSAYSAYPLTGQGTLLNLNFILIGPSGSNVNLSWQSFMFNEGDPAAAPSAGQVGITAAPPVARGQFDFDGDGKSDIAVFRPSDRIWYRAQSSTGFAATQFGLTTDKIVPADYDADGKTDIAVFRNGTWYLFNSGSDTLTTVVLGTAGDIPAPADYDGDGRAEIAVYRNGTWITMNLATNQTTTNQFGLSGDRVVVGDYDADGKADQAIFRSGEWHLNRSTLGYTTFQFGIAGDLPLTADFDGDRKADPTVFRSGVWYIARSNEGLLSFQFGISTDTPIPADYNGDGKADVAVFRNGIWYFQRQTRAFATTQFGTATDQPIQGAFIR